MIIFLLFLIAVVIVFVGEGIKLAILSPKEKAKLTEAEIGIIAALVERRIRDNIK